MSPRWEGCVKIHEGCGGVVRWVEAVDTPGVGYQGECLHCGADRLVVEDILPVCGLDNREALEMDPNRLAQLEWDDDDTWNHNQKRLAAEVGKA